MSGGHFEYQEYRVTDIAETIRGEYIKYSTSGSNKDGESWEKLPDEILNEMKDLYQTLELAYKRVHNLDYFLSGDHGEDTYLELIKEKE